MKRLKNSVEVGIFLQRIGVEEHATRRHFVGNEMGEGQERTDLEEGFRFMISLGQFGDIMH